MLLTGHQSQSPREDLFRVIRQVRQRWRLKIVLRGLAVMVTAGIVAFLLSAFGLEYFRFSAPAIITFRILTYLTLTLLLVWSLLLPLSRRLLTVPTAPFAIAGLRAQFRQSGAEVRRQADTAIMPAVPPRLRDSAHAVPDFQVFQ